jgi:fumarate hydratase subunit alpha
MKKVDCVEITKKVKEECVSINFKMPEELKKVLKEYIKKEDSHLGKDILKDLLINGEIAEKEKVPLCQDTGMVVVFIELGQDVQIINGNLTEAVQEGVRQGYEEGCLRKSIVKCPIRRDNTGDNTPAVIYYDLVPGSTLKIHLAAKGFGSENMSRIKMLKPTDGLKGIKDFVIETVKEAGSNPCPPIIVGIGIGGTFDKAAYLSKKALLKHLGRRHEDGYIAQIETELLNDINNLGIGPQGFGGKTTALDVHIEIYPTHIAGLPIAVNINCHSFRHGEIIF